MAKYSKENGKNIQAIFEEKTGVIIAEKSQKAGNQVWKAVLAFALLFAAGLLTASVYTNRQSSEKIDVGISLLKAETIETHQVDMPQMSGEADGIEITVYEPELVFDGWIWPTESNRISAAFDMVGNDRGITHDHINIAGEKGDAIYSVAEGTVTETGYVTAYGNCIVVDYGDGVFVKYGHLSEIYVEKGDTVTQGQKIGSMGATGMATGPNLSFTVYKDGVAVNPIAD